ncbi:MAG: hypothetical protein AAF721_38155 [Myxococcota bacterium]
MTTADDSACDEGSGGRLRMIGCGEHREDFAARRYPAEPAGAAAQTDLLMRRAEGGVTFTWELVADPSSPISAAPVQVGCRTDPEAQGCRRRPAWGC